MQALVWTAPEKMEMQEYPDPSPTAGEVVIRVAFAGICGSELSGFLGHNALRTPPLVMGHEFAGEIVEVGREVTEFSVGDARDRQSSYLLRTVPHLPHGAYPTLS